MLPRSRRIIKVIRSVLIRPSGEDTEGEEAGTGWVGEKSGWESGRRRVMVSRGGRAREKEGGKGDGMLGIFKGEGGRDREREEV